MKVKLAKIDVRGYSKKDAARKQRDYVKRVRDYAAFLAGDCDFDWSAIVRMFSFKLNRFREHLLEHKAFEGYKEMAAEVKTAVDLLERVRTFDYEAEHLRAFYKKHGKPKVVPKNVDGVLSCEVLYRGKPASEATRRELLACAEMAYKAQKEDLEKALSLVAEKLLTWSC